MKDFFKSYLFKMIMTFLIVIVASYLWFAILPASFPTRDWDWLSFWGNVLSLFGTIFLGLLAIWQNDKFRELADKKDKHHKGIENEKTRLENLPLFSLTSNSIFEIFEKNQNGDFIHPPDSLSKFLINGRSVMLFTLIDGEIIQHYDYFAIKPEDFIVSLAIGNCGNNTANNVRITVRYRDSKINYPYIQTFQQNKSKYFFIDFYKTSEVKIVEMKIEYYDIFQNKYEQSFDVNYFIDHSGKPMLYCKMISEQIWLEKSKFFSNDNDGGFSDA